MKFFAVAATFALAASSVIAAPAAAVEEKRLLGGLLGGNGGGLLGGLLGGNSQVTKLNGVVSGVTNQLNPILGQITSATSGTNAVGSLLGGSFLNSTGLPLPGLDGIPGVEDLLAQLAPLLTAAQLGELTSALENLPQLTTGLQGIITQLLQVVLGLLSGAGAVNGLVSGGAVNGLLSSLLGQLSATQQLNGLVAQLLAALSGVQGLTGAGAAGLGNLDSLTGLLGPITSLTDGGITGLLSGSNNVVGGLLNSVLGLLSLNGLLGGLLGGLGLGGGAGGLSSLLSGLGLNQLLGLLQL